MESEDRPLQVEHMSQKEEGLQQRVHKPGEGRESRRSKWDKVEKPVKKPWEGHLMLWKETWERSCEFQDILGAEQGRDPI